MVKRRIKAVALLTGLILLIFLIRLCWLALPIASGYSAKVMCSGIFISNRNIKSIQAEDLGFFPVKFVKCSVNGEDSSVSCSLFGLAKQKAIYRDRLGATLINDISEEDLRSQQFNLPATRIVSVDTARALAGSAAGSLPLNIDTNKIVRLVDSLFTGQRDHLNKTRALLVLYDGIILSERYSVGIDRTTRLPGWSMAKSITGALAGILHKEKLFELDDPVSIAEWQNDERRNITLKHLLQQISGLSFEEVYERPAHANTMLFVEGNAAAYAAERSLGKKPGTHFRYSSGNTNIISVMMRRKLGDSLYHAFPYSRLFHRIGMLSTVLEPDASGTYVGSSFCYATARDWARFGQLYLDSGKHNGEEIVPEQWIRESVTPSSAALHGEYGFQWWLNAGEKGNITNRLYPNLPADMYFADGYEGQNIFVIPSKRLVVVRLGITRGGHWGESEFLEQLVKAIP